jgi:hypothetical protein
MLRLHRNAVPPRGITSLFDGRNLLAERLAYATEARAQAEEDAIRAECPRELKPCRGCHTPTDHALRTCDSCADTGWLTAQERPWAAVIAGNTRAWSALALTSCWIRQSRREPFVSADAAALSALARLVKAWSEVGRARHLGADEFRVAVEQLQRVLILCGYRP